jgi:hypothetical protein
MTLNLSFDTRQGAQEDEATWFDGKPVMGRSFSRRAFLCSNFLGM